MVGLPIFKFIFLGIRQLTRPVVRHVVTRATNNQKGITRSTCIVLGRVSLGLSGVIADWSHNEALKFEAAKKKTIEDMKSTVAVLANKQGTDASAEMSSAATAATSAATITTAAPASHGADAGTSTVGPGPTPTVPHITAAAATAAVAKAAGIKSNSIAGTGASTTTTAEGSAAAADEPLHKPALYNLTTPRSRSLLMTMTYGPLPKEQDTYDSSVFIDPKRTAGEAARVFIQHPYRSTWDVFQKAFLAPFPEKRLVDAGAELLVELLAYTILATLLYLELKQQFKSAATKEAHLQARLEAIEEKVNELIEHQQQIDQRSEQGRRGRVIQVLPPAPELRIRGRLQNALHAVESGYNSVVNIVFSGEEVNVSLGNQQQGGSSKALTPQKAKGFWVPQVPPPDASVKVSKHDETATMKRELQMAFNEGNTREA